MWNNRPGLILLIHIKRHKRMGWYIPIALPAVEATLESWRETLAFWESILLARINRRPQGILHTGRKGRLSELLALGIVLLQALRHHGSYELVSVESETERIAIRLW